jgi:hypothetical protein
MAQAKIRAVVEYTLGLLQIRIFAEITNIRKFIRNQHTLRINIRRFTRKQLGLRIIIRKITANYIRIIFAIGT